MAGPTRLPVLGEIRNAEALTDEPGPGWTWHDCPEEWNDATELNENGRDRYGNDMDPCQGCAGWGMECAAQWRYFGT